MKKLLMILIIIIFAVLPTAAETVEQLVEQQLTDTDFSQLQKPLGEDFDIKKQAEDFSKNGVRFSLKETANKFKAHVGNALKGSSGILFTLAVIALLSALAENIKSSFGTQSDVQFYVFFALAAVFGLEIYRKSVADSGEALDSLLAFVTSLYPVILTNIAASGGITCASTLHPIVMVCGSAIMLFIKQLVLPLISVSVALKLAAAFSADMQSGRMAKLIDSFVKWSTGIVMTLFIGIVSICGAAVSGFDSVTVRTAKYTIGKFVPLVGGVLSDSFDLILCGSSVIKNSVGFAGLLGILYLCVTPCLKLLATALMFSLCAAICEPVCSKRLIDAIDVFGSTAFLLFGILCACACMFILCTGVLIGMKPG